MAKKKEKVEKKKKTKDAKIKKPLTPYLRFSSVIRESIKEEINKKAKKEAWTDEKLKNSLKITEIAKEIGRNWRQLSGEEKQKYKDEYAKDMEEFKKTHVVEKK